MILTHFLEPVRPARRDRGCEEDGPLWAGGLASAYVTTRARVLPAASLAPLHCPQGSTLPPRKAAALSLSGPVPAWGRGWCGPPSILGSDFLPVLLREHPPLSTLVLNVKRKGPCLPGWLVPCADELGDGQLGDPCPVCWGRQLALGTTPTHSLSQLSWYLRSNDCFFDWLLMENTFRLKSRRHPSSVWVTWPGVSSSAPFLEICVFMFEVRSLQTAGAGLDP